MKKGRLEAFSDGVVAIIITIMVLELKIPHGAALADLRPLLPTFFCYVISFIYVGIYWNNHHHMIYLTEKVNGKILWANLNLLFWLSLIPFVTAWMGENHFATWPVAMYGIILVMNALSYSLLYNSLIKNTGEQSALARAVGKGWKGKISVAIYIIAIGVTFYNSWIGFGLYWIVAIIWFIPDRRIERNLDIGTETEE